LILEDDMRMVSLALAAGLVAAALPAGARAAEPVAIVYGLKGQAFVKATPAGERRPAERFQWLPAAAAIEVAPGATLHLAFAGGARYELRGGAKVTLSGGGGFSASTGPVEALSAVSPLPRLETPSADSTLGTSPGALRLRGGRIAGLYPRDDATALPDEAVLVFEPVQGAAGYRVVVEDEAGTTVHAAEVKAPPAPVPAGVLKPGGRYLWTVRTIGGGPSARGEADFSALAAESLAAREALRRSLQGQDDPESLALLAEVDSRLGLFLEAQRGFQAALARSPADASLQHALDRLARQMAAAPADPRP
jgi:hypothetical protein